MKETLNLYGWIVSILLAALVNTNLIAQSDPESNITHAIKTKDGSFIKGKLLIDNDTHVTMLTPLGDTLKYSHKYIDAILDLDSLDEMESLHKKKKKFHKTEGYFLNINALLRPNSIDFGRRFTPRFYAGLNASFIYVNEIETTENSYLAGIGPYLKLYFNDNFDGPRYYVELWSGASYGNAVEGTNEIKPYGGFNIGIHLPGPKKIRFFFDAGLDFVISKSNFTLENNARIETTKIQGGLLVTFIGIEF